MAQSRAAKDLLLKAYGPARELSRKGEYAQKVKDSDKKIKELIEKAKKPKEISQRDAYNNAMQNAFKNTKVFGIGVGP